MTRYLIVALFALAALCAGLWLKHDRERLVSDLEASLTQVAQLKAANESAVQALASRDALDKKYSEEMTYAKNENERLRADVATGARRLLVRATCPKSVPAAAGATGVDDARDAELTTAAGQDYLRLREQIITTESQLAGLQAYVRQVVQVVK
jgi:prophage endopeptidase